MDTHGGLFYSSEDSSYPGALTNLQCSPFRAHLPGLYLTVFVCLIWFFTSQSTIFQVCWDGSSWVEPVLSKDKCILLKDTTQWLRRGSNLQPFGLESITLHWASALPINTMTHLFLHYKWLHKTGSTEHMLPKKLQLRQTQWHQRGLNLRPLGFESSTLQLSHCAPIPYSYCRTCLKRPLKKKTKKFNTDYCLMQVKSIAKCSKGAFCNTFDLH